MACPEYLGSRLGRLYYRAMMHASARLAVRIITDSIFSKNEIVRFLHIDPAKISVIYPAVDPGFTRISDAAARKAVLSKHGVVGNYIFYTGIYKKRKNHAGLLKSFKRFLELGGSGQLVIAGPIDDGERRLRAIAEKLQMSKQIVFTGFIDDSELCGLYSAARVYACPSLYEGFGFTVLEAMACGTTVVCSESASLPEVAGDAALRANASDPDAFGQALYTAFTDEAIRVEMTGRALKNLQRFSWQQAAKQCLHTYDEAVGSTMAATSPLGERSLSH